MFPPQQRARALSVYSFGIPLGAALGIVLGGVLTSVIGWRAAFMIVGGIGLVLAPIFRLTVREPARGAYDGCARDDSTCLGAGGVARTLFAKRSFWGLSLGAACSSMMGYGLIFWLPSFFVRSYGAELPGFLCVAAAALVPRGASPVLYASYFYGTILLLGGLTGIWLGGALADRYGATRRAAYALVPAAAFVGTIPFFVVGVLSHSLTVAFFAFLVPTALSLVWLGPVLAAFQHLVPPNMRATASAIFLFINNLIGIGAGNLAIGALSDALQRALWRGVAALRHARRTGLLRGSRGAVHRRGTPVGHGLGSLKRTKR